MQDDDYPQLTIREIQQHSPNTRTLVLQPPADEPLLYEAGLTLLHSRHGNEAGQCGNCAVRCTQGHVWMSTNEVLTDRELVRGLVLTCSGYPIAGDVHLDFSPE
ncbi:2Fe-2S iron-sulfur cluster-binding protein [Hymenobacter terrenus]|uniref:2Fe-2S iron-sulfur cluster-binding protein n=1 Tax=Hymenobacter terrenus TaxID=1629124 RepID=UPI000619A413|nr:2Fe-2S iron-sulfur cluster binding domain-containing protein [Hymenobacter terrenus]